MKIIDTPYLIIGTTAERTTMILRDGQRFQDTTDGREYIGNGTIAGGIGLPVASVANGTQLMPVATRTYITGSGLTVVGLKLGDAFQWDIHISKTAAGIATSMYDIAIGVTGTTADAARCSFTKPVGTAVADEGIISIKLIVRSVGMTGVVYGSFMLAHGRTSTGHANVPCVVLGSVSSAFNTDITRIGICATIGAAEVLTVQQIIAKKL